MIKKSFSFSASATTYYFNADFSYLQQIVPKDNAIVITDENIFGKHQRKLKG